MNEKTVSGQLAENPLKTRADVGQALDLLMKPLANRYSPGRARLELGTSGASYSSLLAGMEGFSRVLWGLVPLLAGGGETDCWDTVLEGIRAGTDPAHEEYWGAAADYDQRLVEMAVFGWALAVIPERIWEPLTERERSNFYAWLNQINSRPCYDCNWLFFHVLVNTGFRLAGLPYDAEQTERNLQRIESFYLDEGWYSDGPGGHSDYYVPFAIHYYGLMYAKLAERDDPERARRFKERADRFAQQFLYWFEPEGSALPYGRSLSYRFAQSAFWSALAYAGSEVLSPGEIKGLVLRNLRWWFRQPIVDASGVLTVGYAYPNLVMAENYNSPGSPYWSFKTFLPLALPEDHPFWQAEELPLPEGGVWSVQKPAHLVISRSLTTGHVAAFNSGHPASNEHTHTSAKYEKFVYSTAFGFSVPRAEWGLAQGAFDSMLALSERDNLFRVRRRNTKTEIHGNVVYAKWQPWHDVEVDTWIVAGLPWHLRVHRIASARPLDAAEGGFALGLEPDTGTHTAAAHAQAAAAYHPLKGVSSVTGLIGYRAAELVYPNSNTNVLNPRTVLPTLRAELEPGVHWLVSLVYGEPAPAMAVSANQDNQGHQADQADRADLAQMLGLEQVMAPEAGAEALERLQVVFDGKTIVVQTIEGKELRIDMTESGVNEA